MIAAASSKLLADLKEDEIETLAYLEENNPLGTELAKLMKYLFSVNTVKSRGERSSIRSAFENAIYITKLKRSAELNSDELDAMEILQEKDIQASAIVSDIEQAIKLLKFPSRDDQKIIAASRIRLQMKEVVDQLREFDAVRRSLKSKIKKPSENETPIDVKERENAIRLYEKHLTSNERKAISISLQYALSM